MSSSRTDDTNIWKLLNEDRSQEDLVDDVAQAISELEHHGEVRTYATRGDHGQEIRHVSHKDLYPKVIQKLLARGLELSPMDQDNIKRLVYQYAEVEAPRDLDTMPLPFKDNLEMERHDPEDEEEDNVKSGSQEDPSPFRGDSLLDDDNDLESLKVIDQQGMHPIDALIDYGYKAGNEGTVIDPDGGEHYIPELFFLLKQKESNSS